MAFENASPPGIITLSPLWKPAIDVTIAVSKVVNPVTLIDRIKYSFATFDCCKANSPGSTDVGFCAKDADAINKNESAKIPFISRCMMNNSVTAMVSAVWGAN